MDIASENKLLLKIRSSFFGKVTDTHSVLIEILHIFTLWLFKFNLVLNEFLSDFRKRKFEDKVGFEKYAFITAKLIANVFYLPLKAIDFLINNFVFPVVAAILTFVSLPFIGLAHKISSTIAKSKEEETLAINFTIKEKKDKNKLNINTESFNLQNTTTTKTLREFLSEHDESLIKLKLSKIKGTGEYTEKNSHLSHYLVNSISTKNTVNFPAKLTFTICSSSLLIKPYKAKLVCQNSNDTGIQALAQINKNVKDKLDERSFFRK